MARHDEKTLAGRAKMLSRGDTEDRLVKETDWQRTFIVLVSLISRDIYLWC